MDSIPKQLHFVLIPLLAQGHMIPMVDIARQLSNRGVIVSFVTTPLNASRTERSFQQSPDNGVPIRVLEIPFPCEKVGLPRGCENLDMMPSPDPIIKFYNAMSEMQVPLEEYLKRQDPPPSCIISDKCLSWTSKIAESFQIPRIVFHGMCCFSLLASHNMKLHNSHQLVSSDSQPFVVPGMPHTVEMTKAQLPGAFVALPNLDKTRGQMQEAESTAYGVVVNSFNELEHRCIEEYQKAIKKKIWCIGPVSLCNKGKIEKLERGNKASIDEKKCTGWLDSMHPRSVVYVCLGSQCRLVPSQLIELGLGLESSNHPFIWIIKSGERQPEVERWLEENRFEDRVKGRGLLIKGWAPQMLILSHPAIKGFLTHCGWNSVIEAISFGVPMITWPQFAEQFLNEKLVVNVLKIAVPVGVETAVRWGEEEKVGVLVRKTDIEAAIDALTAGGEEGKERRRRAKQLGEMARTAVAEGGSSEINLSRLIQDIRERTAQQLTG